MKNDIIQINGSEIVTFWNRYSMKTELNCTKLGECERGREENFRFTNHGFNNQTNDTCYYCYCLLLYFDSGK